MKLKIFGNYNGGSCDCAFSCIGNISDDLNVHKQLFIPHDYSYEIKKVEIVDNHVDNDIPNESNRLNVFHFVHDGSNVIVYFKPEHEQDNANINDDFLRDIIADMNLQETYFDTDTFLIVCSQSSHDDIEDFSNLGICECFTIEKVNEQLEIVMCELNDFMHFLNHDNQTQTISFISTFASDIFYHACNIFNNVGIVQANLLKYHGRKYCGCGCDETISGYGEDEVLAYPQDSFLFNTI